MQHSPERTPADEPGSEASLVPPAVTDPTPPDDHEDFLVFQAMGCRNIRHQLEKRRKKK